MWGKNMIIGAIAGAVLGLIVGLLANNIPFWLMILVTIGIIAGTSIQIRIANKKYNSNKQD